MTMWNELLGNQILISAVLGWTVAQFLKTVIDMVINKSFNPERVFGSGGMPSSHSATVCALTTASGMKYGVGSFEFAISFVLAMIVMYDAMGVRRETGKQAKLLNSVFFENILNLDGVFLQEKLKEYVKKIRICGPERNSYSKADHDATFIRSKGEVYAFLGK